MSKKSTSKIELDITLDKDSKPEKIHWKTSDHKEFKDGQNAKAMFLSLFDESSKETLKLDLWTKDFQVAEMDRFIYYSLRSMADTYIKSTNNKELANSMQQFAQYFGEQTEIISKSE
jgi:gliding motility-associated protein GldC